VTKKANNVQPLSFKKGNNVCNICGGKRNLTDDHVPPRCCGNDKPVVARRMQGHLLRARQVDAKSLNGLKFRTLCRDCNSMLGAWDNALGGFAAQVKSVIIPAVVLPDLVTLTVRPGAVLRSVLGHVVAAKVQDDKVTTDQKIRDYLLGSNGLDPAIKVYCWPYPAGVTVVSRDFTFVDVEGEGGKSPGLISVVKFHPLAFCVLDGHDQLKEAQYLTELHGFANTDPRDEATVQIRIRPPVYPPWPETAHGNHLVLGGRTYVDSVTTQDASAMPSTPGKRVIAERWPGGDNALIQGLHAFAEIADPQLPEAPSPTVNSP